MGSHDFYRSERSGSGLRHNQARTQAMQAMAEPATHRCVGVAKSTQALTAMAMVALHLARLLTLRPCAQLRSGGPNNG